MRRQSLLLLFLFLNLFHGKAQEEIKILSPTYEFSQGSTEYLFANKVKLREAPSKTAKIVNLLPAGSGGNHIGKTINYELYEGIESSMVPGECQWKNWIHSRRTYCFGQTKFT